MKSGRGKVTRRAQHDNGMHPSLPEVGRDSARLKSATEEYQRADAQLRQLYEDWERVAAETTSA